MKYFEYGKENKELVVILHGGGVSYRGAEPTAKIVAEKYHVILCKITGRTAEEAERLLYRHATWKSWKNQDYCLIGKKTDYSLFERTDMHLWYGIKGTADKKFSANLERLKEQGYPFRYKIFTELGHGGLAGEQPERFLKEMINAHEAQKGI